MPEAWYRYSANTTLVDFQKFGAVWMNNSWSQFILAVALQTCDDALESSSNH